MTYTTPFSSLTKHDGDTAGGKGASLGEMTRAGIPVPPGFVILTNAFERFLDVTDLRQEVEANLESVDHTAVHTAERASEQIQSLILAQDIPEDIKKEIISSFTILNSPFVAVRSSATAEDGAENAWAGQLDSFLNTTESTLLENVKRCWASLFTPRAIFYRIETHMRAHGQDPNPSDGQEGLKDSHVSVAVVVQKMVQSEVSGIAFSVHPVTEDQNQLIIEAGWGLGEAIVSGSITPDSYVVEKEPRRIIDKNISEQEKKLVKNGTGNDWIMVPYSTRRLQKLFDENIFELAQMVIQIEDHYDSPQDIEWAFADNILYIVQSRPITTLQNV